MATSPSFHDTPRRDCRSNRIGVYSYQSLTPWRIQAVLRDKVSYSCRRTDTLAGLKGGFDIPHVKAQPTPFFPPPPGKTVMEDVRHQHALVDGPCLVAQPDGTEPTMAPSAPGLSCQTSWVFPGVYLANGRETHEEQQGPMTNRVIGRLCQGCPIWKCKRNGHMGREENISTPLMALATYFYETGFPFR